MIMASDASSTTLESWLNGIGLFMKNTTEDQKFIASIKELSASPNEVRGDISKYRTSILDEMQVELSRIINNGENNFAYAYIGTLNNRFQQAPVEDLGLEYNCSEREWFQEAINTDSYYISSPYIDVSNNNPCITIAVPIKDNGNAIGVFAVDILLDSISREIDKFNIGESSFITLITEEDDEYRIMYSTDGEISKNGAGKVIVNENIVNDSSFGILNLNNILSEVKSTKEKSKLMYDININNKEYSCIVIKDEILNVYKMVGIEKSEFYKPLIKLFIEKLLIICFICMIVCIVIYMNLINISKSINYIGVLINKLKDNDLVVDKKFVKSKGNTEIEYLTNNLNDTIIQFKDMIKSIQDASKIIEGSSEELHLLSQKANNSSEDIFNSMNNITSSSLEQIEAIQKCANVTNEVSKKLQIANDSGVNIKAIINDVQESNEEGIIAINNLKVSNNETNMSNEKVINNIQELNNQTEYIKNIIDTISNISQKTHLLSLNASIEAARYGEVGKGFSVVADEIKKLSEQSKVATKEIEDTISTININIEKVVDNMSENNKILNEQNIVVYDVEKAFLNISKSNNEVVSLVIEIVQLLEEINSDKNQIMNMVDLVMALNEESSAACQEINATMEDQMVVNKNVYLSSDKLNILSKKLNELIAKFKV